MMLKVKRYAERISRAFAGMASFFAICAGLYLAAATDVSKATLLDDISQWMRGAVVLGGFYGIVVLVANWPLAPLVSYDEVPHYRPHHRNYAVTLSLTTQDEPLKGLPRLVRVWRKDTNGWIKETLNDDVPLSIPLYDPDPSTRWREPEGHGQFKFCLFHIKGEGAERRLQYSLPPGRHEALVTALGFWPSGDYCLEIIFHKPAYEALFLVSWKGYIGSYQMRRISELPSELIA